MLHPVIFILHHEMFFVSRRLGRASSNALRPGSSSALSLRIPCLHHVCRPRPHPGGRTIKGSSHISIPFLISLESFFLHQISKLTDFCLQHAEDLGCLQPRATIPACVCTRVQSYFPQFEPHLQRNSQLHATMGLLPKPQWHVLLLGDCPERHRALPRDQRVLAHQRHRMACL